MIILKEIKQIVRNAFLFLNGSLLPSRIAVLPLSLLFLACVSFGASAENIQPFQDTVKRNDFLVSIGARTRVVWVQDVGDGGDTFAAGGNLRLMGLDTADGAGERAILSTVGSYVRPLITPKGDRVVYSDRIRKKVFVVNWNGTGLREIVSGFAMAVWMDLRDGREWVYFGEENWGPDRDHTTEVYRMPLDGSGSRELVWNQTPVMVVGFQLSVDGRMASGNFPWPDGGVADLERRS